MKISNLLFWTILISCLSSRVAIGQERSLSSLDQYFERARKDWSVPGMSVTIVKDGQVILSKGYGSKSIKTPGPVDKETLFMMGSTTKAMTAMLMAMMVDEGKVAWEDKVIKHLPWFRLHDPYVTSQLTVKDLFTHNSGLGNTDLLWVLWDYSTEEIVRRLRYQPLKYSLRGSYTYQNIMYAAAGLIIEQVSDRSWERMIQERIFNPLGMESSCALKSCAEGFENIAKPHFPGPEGIIQIIDSNADSISAAGSAWSTSEDLAKWMNYLLDSCRINGERTVSEEQFRMLTKPHIIIPDRSFYPSAVLTKPTFTAYSLGWFLHDYKDSFVQFHTGSLNGSGAIIGLMPEYNLGVYIMTNLERAEVRHALMYQTFDHFMGKESERDWSADLLPIYNNINNWRKERRSKQVSNRIKGTSADFPLTEMTGTYTNDFLGHLTLSIVDEQVQINCRPDRHILLEHWHFNTFMGRIKEYEHDLGDLIDFDIDETGAFSFKLQGFEFRRID